MDYFLFIVSVVLGLFIASKFNIAGFGGDAREAIGAGCGMFLGIWMFATVIVYSIISSIFL